MIRLPALWLAACCLLTACIPGVPPGPGGDPAFALPALRAEPDPVAAGRIVDAHGREVLLRGVNVNAYVEYWAHDPALFTTYPLTEADADAIAAMGWNVVRLLLSWSRVEPQPGVYDEAYLDAIEAAVRLLESRGVYSIVDLHQDAWGPTLAARPDEACGASPPAFGWDGAPGWATLVDDATPRCIQGGSREFSPAVLEAFQAFWDDAPGPGDVGIRARYVAMLAHVARRFAGHDAVAGYDPMNEPNAWWLLPGQLAALSDFYAEALAAIRAAEDEAGAPHRLFFFEPSISWAGSPAGAPPDFARDDQVVYAPHLYQGGLDGQPLDARWFDQARAEAAVYGGAPVLSGEWGSDPRRAGDRADEYFQTHQGLQDEFRFGATLWTWREACGDPHKAADFRAGRSAYVWGLFDVDCDTNTEGGVREPLRRVLRRPFLRAAPGPIETLEYHIGPRVLEATGRGAEPWSTFVAFVPSVGGLPPRVSGQGLGPRSISAAPGGGHYVAGFVKGGDWEIRLQAR